MLYTIVAQSLTHDLLRCYAVLDVYDTQCGYFIYCMRKKQMLSSIIERTKFSRFHSINNENSSDCCG